MVQVWMTGSLPARRAGSRTDSSCHRRQARRRPSARQLRRLRQVVRLCLSQLLRVRQILHGGSLLRRLAALGRRRVAALGRCRRTPCLGQVGMENLVQNQRPASASEPKERPLTAVNGAVFAQPRRPDR